MISLGCSDAFVSIDTEEVRAWAAKHHFDMFVSTDGDVDRLLIADKYGEFLRGDIIDILCALYLKAPHVATPASSNTAAEKSVLFNSAARAKIGSPYVIEAIHNLKEKHPEDVIFGYETNVDFYSAQRLSRITFLSWYFQRARRSCRCLPCWEFPKKLISPSRNLLSHYPSVTSLVFDYKIYRPT